MPSLDVQILATALALGIAIDAVIVRSLLAPALVAVLGRANWTLPRPLARLLRMGDRQRGDWFLRSHRARSGRTARISSSLSSWNAIT